MAIENGTLSYMPPENLHQFEQDIAALMGFAGSSDDTLVSPYSPDTRFIEFWRKANKGFPQFLSMEQTKALEANNVNHIVPWGWSYVLKHRLKHLISDLSPNCYLPDAATTAFRQFFSRQTSVAIAKQLYTKKDRLPVIAHQPYTPQTCCSSAEVLVFFQNHPQGIILKTLWSSSGRGLFIIHNSKDLDQAERWIQARIKQHQCIIAEPFLDKVQDASFQFIIKPDGSYESLGINYFDADGSGRFQKEHFGIPPNIQPHLPKDEGWIDDLSELLIESMQELNIHLHYQGSVGIDVLFFRNEAGCIQLMPFIEANLRYNMGLINLLIKKHIHPESTGDWQITPFKAGEWAEFCRENLQQYPAVFEDGYLKEGFMPLTPCHAANRFAAWGFVKAPK